MLQKQVNANEANTEGQKNLDMFTLHWLECMREPLQAAAWSRIAMVLHCGAGGARKVGGGGVLPAPAVGPEAHLLLAWLGRLLEWSCTRYAPSTTSLPPSPPTPLAPNPSMACSYQTGLAGSQSGVCTGKDEGGVAKYDARIMYAIPTPGLAEVEPSMSWNPSVVAGIGVVADPAVLYQDMHSYLASSGHTPGVVPLLNRGKGTSSCPCLVIGKDQQPLSMPVHLGSRIAASCVSVDTLLCC